MTLEIDNHGTRNRVPTNISCLRKASETVEMVTTTALLCIIVVNLMLILSYALQVNQVAYGAKRLARVCEIDGTVSETLLKDRAKSLIPNWDYLNADLKVDADWSDGGDQSRSRVQLRKKFRITITGTYPIVLANPGSGGKKISLPLGVYVVVDGMSEKYWK